jgi:hypothetical protein
MPRGAESFSKHNQAVEQRREEAQSQYGPKADYFKISGGQFAVLRFLEQGTDIAWASNHRVPTGGAYPSDELCLDQNDDGTPCPYCASEFKDVRARSTKGYYNVIWRGNVAFQQLNAQILANNAIKVQNGQPPDPTYTLAPIYKRNSWGSPERDPNRQPIILGYEDGIFLWKSSKTVHNQLVEKDSHYQGLMSRDFVVRRTGNKVDDTAYYIDPANVNVGAIPMSAEDQALYEKRYNLDEFITPKTYEAAAELLSKVPGNQQGGNGQQQTFDRGGAPAGMPPMTPPLPGQMTAGPPMAGQPDPSAPTPFQAPPPGQMPQQ